MVLRFDLSSITIPDGSEISSANLYLYNYGPILNFGNPPKRLFHITEEWAPETATWFNKPEIAWESSAKVYDEGGFNKWEKLDALPLVRDITSGDSTNHGFAVNIDMYEYGGITYYSSEHSDITLRPKLELLISDNLSPKLSLLTHNGDKPVYGKTSETIEWEASDDDSLVAVSVHFNVDFEWILIDSITDGRTSCIWNIPAYEYRKRTAVKVTAIDNTGKISIDSSAQAFIIERPTPTLSQATLEQQNVAYYREGENMRFTIKKEEPVFIQIFDIQGRSIGSFTTKQSEHSYTLPLPQGKMLFLRMVSKSGEKSFKLRTQ